MIALAALVTSVSAQPVTSADATPWDSGIVAQVRQILKVPAIKQTWSAWGGSIGMRWNNDLFRGMGITTSFDGPIAKSDPLRHQWFSLRESGGLEFAVANGSLRHFSGGSLQMRGGYVLHLRDGSSVDLRNATFRVRASDPSKLDLVSNDGKIWLYTDRLMFELVNHEQSMAIRAADLRIMPALAARIGDPKLANLEIGDVEMNTEVYVAASSNPLDPDLLCDPYPWPGVAVPGTNDTYKIDLFMKSMSVSPAGCEQTLAGGTCDGPGGATDGYASLVPSSTLINNMNNGTAVATIPGDPLGTSSALYAANIPWYTMFGRYNANPPINGPYNNDQHPYLIWNMYRVGADGSIDQIGRSGVKHAFLTINLDCLNQCLSVNPSHEVGLGCEDTYGTSNNDQPADMGPRSEIIPATGIWGRCGSIWDPLTGNAPGTCKGTYNATKPNDNTAWSQRLLTRESQIDPSVNPGTTYYFESWYATRDDIDIYNSMATMTGVPTWNPTSHTWVFYSQANYRLGPAIDRWVDPVTPPANTKSAEIANSEGHVKVAVKATSVGGGKWRYDYAVMNLDFARGLIDPAHNLPPNIHVIHNYGFDKFRVLIAPTVTVSNLVFDDGDGDPTNDWTISTAGGPVTWSAPINPNPMANVPPVLNPLNWGTLYKFSFVANAAPINITTSLHIAQSGDPISYEAVVLGPSSDMIFDSSFDTAIPASAQQVPLDWSK